MTLENAIREVLASNQSILSAGRIAEIINEQELYLRRDQNAITSSQILQTAQRLPNEFRIVGSQNVVLVNRSIIAYRTQYFRIVNILRHTNLTENHIMILAAALIFMSWSQNDSRERSIDNAKHELISDLLDSTSRTDANQLFENLVALIELLNERECKGLIDSMNKLRWSKRPNRKIFGEFFDDIINQYTNTDFPKSSSHSTPKAISAFIGSIYSIPDGGSILDPFAGYSSSLTRTYSFNQEQNPIIHAIDVNLIASQLGALNLIANGCKKFTYDISSFLFNYQKVPNVDLIVTSPPFGIKSQFNDFQDIIQLIGEEFNFLFPRSNESINFNILSILACINKLKQNGKAVIVITDGVLFSSRKEFYLLREYLLTSKILKGIISLPKNIFRPHMTVSCSVLILEKSNYSSHDLFLFDGSAMSVLEFERKSTEIISAYHDRSYKIVGGISVNYHSISTFNFDLSPKRFLLDKLEDEEYKYLNEITEFIHAGTAVSKANINRIEGIPFLQVGDLIEVSGINEVDASRAEYFVTDNELLPKEPRYIQNNSVLVVKVGTKLKPSLFKSIEPTLCNTNIIVIKADEDYILPEYLITQFQSDYVLQQVDAIRHNVGVPHFSKADLIAIKIKVLPILEQRRYVSSFYGKKLEEEKTITEKQREQDLYNVIASLKHELKQPVSSIGMDLKVLEEYLKQKTESGSAITSSDFVVDLLPGQNPEENPELLLRSVMRRMESSVSDAQGTLSKAEEILNIGSGMFSPENFSIKKFLISVIKPMYVNANCILNISGEEQSIFADRYQIEILFKRLIENAIKHGFVKGSSKRDNVINIRLSNTSVAKEFHEIIVENNGKEFPSEFDVSRFQLQGQTTNRYSGTGFGGFHVKRIIESHKGEILIADKNEIGTSQFKVRFKIYLP